ncbi:MAG: homocysteine S-methyltransferase family protein [Armatimonadetes bacterium]|nr:homocysteine S-methyltransferase family protein [Armatimonadota bacterium]
MDLLSCLGSGRVVVLDGAMGTQLDKRGVTAGGQNNLAHPDVVQAVHQDYIRAGVKGLITNTLTMNRLYLETHRVDIDIREANRAGARLAREVAGADAFVLGDMSATGQILEPYGDYTEEQFYEAFREQAAILAEGGVDGFIIETIFDLREAVCALKACKDASSLPTLVSMSFSTVERGGRTIMGNTAEACARTLTDEGADALGANCGDLDPDEMAVLVSMFRQATPLPLMAQPNAGKPVVSGGKTEYNLSPEGFAAGILKCLDAGAQIIGGCCGTSPLHMEAVIRGIGNRG